jgi:nicotinamide riboside transporter PnuC
MNKVEKKGKMLTIGWITIGFALLFYITVTWEDLINGDFLSKGNVLMLVIILAALFKLFTWRNDEKAKQDELGKHIVNKSSVIGYRILTTLLFFLWITDRFLYNHSNEFGNLFLFVGFCMSVILLPIIQLIISRKYR